MDGSIKSYKCPSLPSPQHLGSSTTTTSKSKVWVQSDCIISDTFNETYVIIIIIIIVESMLKCIPHHANHVATNRYTKNLRRKTRDFLRQKMSLYYICRHKTQPIYSLYSLYSQTTLHKL